MECQVCEIEHFQHYLFFLFNQGIMVTKAECEMCAVYEEGAVPQLKAFIRVPQFKNEKFSTELLTTF